MNRLKTLPDMNRSLLWPLIVLVLIASVRNDHAAEFNASTGPLIWDFSGTYPDASWILYQDPAGKITGSITGWATGDGASAGITNSIVYPLILDDDHDSDDGWYPGSETCVTSLIVH